MNDFRDQIIETMMKWRPPYALTDDEISRVADALFSTIESFLIGADEATRNDFRARIIARFKYIDHALYRDVNPDAFPMDEFRAELARRAEPMRDGKSVHLELGVSKEWPQSRADAYVMQECIGDVIRLDMNPNYELEVVGSVTALPFADESIDRIYSNSLFEHVPYPHDIIREAFRVLRPGGYILTVVPFHFVEHVCPGDFLRYTGQFFEQVGGDAGFVDIYIDTKSCSGVYYTTHQLLKAGIVMDRESHPICQSAQLMHAYSLLLLAAAQVLDPFFHAHGASCWHTTYALMSKPGSYAPRTDTIDRSKPIYERFDDLICPRTGLPLKVEGEEMVSLDNQFRYPIIDSKPQLFIMHGFNSSFTKAESSREKLAAWRAAEGIPA